MRPALHLLLLAYALLAPAATAGGSGKGEVWRVRVRTRLGSVHTGYVRAAPPWSRARAGARIEPARVGPDARLVLEEFDGLRGSLALPARDLASIEVLESLDAGAFEAMRAERRARAAERRRRLVAERQAERALEAATPDEDPAAGAAQGTGDADAHEPYAGLPEPLRRWLLRFPPEEGWVPEKRDELYHFDVILDSRPLTEREREWLDHFEQWKAAYDAWLRLESERKGSGPRESSDGPPPRASGR